MTIPCTFETAARQSTAVILGLFLGLGMSGSLASHENGAKVAVDGGEKLFDPANRPLISYRDFDTYLSVVRRGERLSVLVEAYGRIGSPVELPDEFAQVDQIQKGPDGKAIVLGRATGLVSDVAIIDIRRRSLLDHFWAYQPKSSPNGRWIAFVKFFPAHGAYFPEDQYRLYDLTRTPQQNRPVRPDLGTGTPSPTVEAGLSLYPLVPSERDRENIGVEDGTAHKSASYFFWSEDSSKLVFADAQAATMSIVMVSMSPTASIQHETWIVELRGMCADDCTGVRLKSVHFFEATLETEFEQIIAGRKLPKTASRIQLPLTELRPAPR